MPKRVTKRRGKKPKKAEINMKVMQMVEREIRKRPNITNEVLFSRGKKIDPSIGQLTKVQFNARYTLQAKGRVNGWQRKGAATRRKNAAALVQEPSSTGAAHWKGEGTNGTPSLDRDKIVRVFRETIDSTLKADSRADFLDLLTVAPERGADKVIATIQTWVGGVSKT